MSPAAAPDDPKDQALAFFEALNRHDADGALDLLAPDAVVEIVPAGLAASASGGGGRFVRDLVAAFPDLWIQVRSTMATAEVAIVEVKMEGTQAREFLGAVNQEKHLDVDQAWMAWSAGGRIGRLRAYWCQNQALSKARGQATRSHLHPGDAMTSPDAAKIVLGFFDAYRARDVEAMVDACSEGADFHYVPFEVWGKQRVLRGDGKVRSIGKVL